MVLAEAIKDFARSGSDDPRERARFREEVIRALRLLAPPPEALPAILGADHRSAVSRQLLYQRYLESWRVEWPLRLRILYEGRRGQDPEFREIRPHDGP